MLEYLIIFLCVAVPTLGCLYVALREKGYVAKDRMPRITDHKSALKALDKNDSPSVVCHILKHSVHWIEDGHKRVRRNKKTIEEIKIELHKLDALEKLVNKMSVIVLNQQEKGKE